MPGVRDRGGNARGQKQWRLREGGKGVSGKRRVKGRAMRGLCEVCAW